VKIEQAEWLGQEIWTGDKYKIDASIDPRSVGLKIHAENPAMLHAKTVHTHPIGEANILHIDSTRRNWQQIHQSPGRLARKRKLGMFRFAAH